MEQRTLGRSDLNITRIGIGAWAIGGGKWEFGWGAQDDQESIAAIRAGLERGMNWIDTAAVYGLGHSETVVGHAIKGLHAPPYVFSKCSLTWDESGKILHNLEAASIRREAEASLKRLGVGAIDLYQIHWPAWKGAAESASPGSIEEAVGELAKLQAEGKIRHIGLSNFDTRQMQRALDVAPVTSLQPQYSLLARGAESSVLPFAREHGIGGDRLLPHGFRSADRRHDAGARSGIPRRRLAQTEPELSGAAALPQPAPGRDPARRRQAPQCDARRGRHRVDPAKSRCDWSDCGRPQR